jgi:hypothetical protein
LCFFACEPKNNTNEQTQIIETVDSTEIKRLQYVKERLAIYAPVKLTTDLSQLTENEKKMLPILIRSAQIMDDLFWKVAWGNKYQLLDSLKDEETKQLALINYGAWDRLNDDKSFVAGIGEKPLGAQFYPLDMTKEEFEKANLKDGKSLYTLIKRDSTRKLITVPYREAFKEEIFKAAELLEEAAVLAEDKGLQKYLKMRAEALLTDNYKPSDIAWLDMKTNGVDIIIGAIENYEDKLFGYKAAFEAYVLVKDKIWSKRLEKFTTYLPELQKTLPVDAKYKKEKPGSDSQLNAYDVVYYAGDCNAGSKTIAVNLPNDEDIQIKKGTRRSQLKNAMKAKFDKILQPISNLLIAEEQRKNITFDAFFSNVMFHEVAHGLGIKNTISGKGTVKDALKEQHSALEEAKADILGLFMVQQLFEKKLMDEGNPDDNYVTFIAGIFRSVRFGASSAHGKANMLAFNYFLEKGAFIRDEATGTYKVDIAKSKEAMNGLSAMILQLQGDGDYEKVKQVLEEKGKIPAQLQADLDRLKTAQIPVDVVFEQGVSVLGLE